MPNTNKESAPPPISREKHFQRSFHRTAYEGFLGEKNKSGLYVETTLDDIP